MEYKINPWINKLLGVYQYSKSGNSDNRGLDTDFARETYIPTKLDTELLPDIINGKFKAVFLTGNAGDGKTAFLEKVYEALKSNGGETIEKISSGWIVKYQGKIYKACYDASESEKDGRVSANERLLRLYDHLKGNTEPITNVIILTAINDGKLHAFLNEFKRDFYWLAQTVFNQIFGKNTNEETVCIVNLKDRTLVDLEFDGENENSLFDKTLKIFSDKKNYNVCFECEAKEKCPIFYNAKTFGFADFSNKIRARLKLLFTISHLRHQRHNTMRNIRSALSYVITSNLSCEDVHNLVRRENYQSIFESLYFNSIYNSPDEALIELREIDPGLKLLPKLDRKIYSYHLSSQFDKLESALYPVNIKIDYSKINLSTEKIIFSWRRRYYFESDNDKLVELFDEIENQNNLLPYSFLKTYLKNLQKLGKLNLLLNDLSKGIAQLEGIRDYGLAKEYILIKITQNKREGLTVCKQFPLNEFQVFTPNNNKQYLETIPYQMILKHTVSGIQTKINLDIYEILRRMAEGQLPASEEQKPVLDELNEFKSRLQRNQSDRLLLIESNGRYHHIRQVQGIIERLNNIGVE